MIESIPVEYTGGSKVSGPLLVVENVSGVGWDENASVTLDSGEVRHGVVLAVDDNLAVVQVFEGTSGIRLSSVRVAFGGTPLRVPVGPEWLGRV
jgi:V/A-type H+/Na+-transporting ATPase subunit B